MTRTYIDSNVLIAAARGNNLLASLAFAYLDNAQRTFVSSAFVRLEVLPKPLYLKREDEAEFYTAFFDAVVAWAPVTAALIEQAYDLASTYGLSAVDALHAASALALQAEELITAERPQKPIHRVAGVRVISLYANSVGGNEPDV